MEIDVSSPANSITSTAIATGADVSLKTNHTTEILHSAETTAKTFFHFKNKIGLTKVYSILYNILMR